jgi:hypothetical protein
VLPAFPVADAVFDCEIGPLSPGLLIRIWMTMFCACCAAEAAAFAACCVAASIDDATSPAPLPLPCPCVVEALFVAPAWDEAVFACETAPLSPGLSLRIETTALLASCVASAAAFAACSVAAWA